MDKMLEELTRYKEKIENAEHSKAQAEGKLEYLQNSLKELGFSDPEKYMADLRKSIADKEKVIEEKITKLSGSYDWDS